MLLVYFMQIATMLRGVAGVLIAACALTCFVCTILINCEDPPQGAKAVFYYSAIILIISIIIIIFFPSADVWKAIAEAQ